MEAPGTFRGHALEARIGNSRFVGWEKADGSWALSKDDGKPIPCADWTEVRRISEGKPAKNPLDPLTATAAAGGMAMAMRYFLMNNPEAPADPAKTVLHVVPVQWLARPPRCDRYGNIWLLARRGYRRKIRRAAKRAKLPFPIQVMEASS